MQDQVVHFLRTGKWNPFPVVIPAFTETTIDGFQLTSEMLKDATSPKLDTIHTH